MNGQLLREFVIIAAAMLKVWFDVCMKLCLYGLLKMNVRK